MLMPSLPSLLQVLGRRRAGHGEERRHIRDPDFADQGGFDPCLSPGDVESISSEGDVPEVVGEQLGLEVGVEEGEEEDAEVAAGEATTPVRESFTPQPPTIPSPPPTPEDPEQFEPILSDEDPMEDLDQFQDIDFEDTEEPDRTFDPFLELQPLEYLADPGWSPGEVSEWRLSQEVAPSEAPPEVAKLTELLQVPLSEGNPEVWVDAAEQVANIVVTALPHSPEHVDALLCWVSHGLDISAAIAQPQPGLKVRHLKVGLRLTLALCSCGSEVLATLLRSRLFSRLFDVFHGEYMALPLRLLALRVMDCALRSVSAVQNFLEDKGYEKLLQLLQDTKLARLQFAISALLRKIHFYENMKQLQEMALAVSNNPDSLAEHSAKFSSALEELYQTYKDAPMKLGQFRRFLPVKSQFDTPAQVHDPYTSLYSFMSSHRTLQTLLIVLSHPHASESLVTPVLDMMELLLSSEHGLLFLASQPSTSLTFIRALLSGEVQETPGARLGLRLAYCMRVLAALDQLCALQARGEVNSETSALESLRTLYCFGETLQGRLCTAHVVTQGSLVRPIISAISSNRGALPGRSYAMDLLINAIILVDNPTFLNKHGEGIRELIAQEQRLTNLNLWLKNVNVHSVQTLHEVIKNLEEKAGNLPGELVSALRALQYVALPPRSQVEETSEFLELKQRHALLELFALEGATTLSTVLSKLAETFEQPALHTAIMLGPKGTRLVGLMLPAISLLRAMLTLVASSQGASYRNLTSVPALLSSYTLLHAFPLSSPLLPVALQARQETVLALLAYTQPCSEEALPKSLWTQMLAEVLKHATLCPNTFLPGLELLSELLPLPLPISSDPEVLEEDEAARVTSLHRLWGAHLHPLASAVHELVSLLGAASSPPLLALLKRVCQQLSDLDPSSALMVGRALLEPTTASIKADHVQGRCSALSMRRLALLSSVCGNPAPKAALLHLLRTGRADEDGPLAALCWALSKGEPSGKAQSSVARLFAVLCDPSMAPLILSTPANPSRELLTGVISALIQFIIDGSKYGPKSLVPALEALITIAGTEIGLYHIKICMESKERPLLPLLTTCSSVGPEAEGLLETTLSLLKVCVAGEGPSTQWYTARLVGWPAAEETTHPVKALASPTSAPPSEAVSVLLKSLEDFPANEPAPTRELTEPTTPSSETLVSQFSQRCVATPTAEDWAEPPGSEGGQSPGSLERLDLAELAAASLPELNLVQELSRLSQMHRAEEQARQAKAEAAAAAHLQARERGLRRPYMSPMRGRVVFGRAMPVPRGDTFRSRPPNTSRPPSLHVDDFLALESAGQQPTGPTGYNKQTMRAKEFLVSRPRVRTRGVVSERGSRFASPNMSIYRRDNTRGISRGMPPNLGRGTLGENAAPSWPGEQRMRAPLLTSDKLTGGWGERGGGPPRRDVSVPRHPRTFSRT